MSVHKTFTSVGYDKAKSIVDAINLLGGEARLGETWMDYGAGISWETIMIFHKKLDMEYQALDPRDFDEINNGTISVESVRELVEKSVRKSC